MVGRLGETSWLSSLQQKLELTRVTALQKEGVRILALGQEDTARGYTSRAEMMGEPLRSLLAAAIAVDIEGEIDGARAIA